MQIIIEKGRPTQCVGRLQKEIKVYDILDNLKIEYLRADHETAHTMEQCKEIEKVLGAPICKNLFLCNRQKTKFYLLLMPSDKPFKTKDLSQQINSSRLSFASDDDLEKYLNLTSGSCTIFGLSYDLNNNVQLVIDEDVLRNINFGCHPCINTSTISFETNILLNVIIPYLNHTFIPVKL